MTAILAAMSGCGLKLVDPCAGQSGTCVAVQINGAGAVTTISGATVHVTGDGIDQSATLALRSGRTSELPVALAILFVNVDTPTAAHVDVVGLLNGAPVGYGSAALTIMPRQHSTVQVQLTSIAPTESDLAGVDGDAPDMASTDLAGYVPLTVQLTGSGSGNVVASGLACAGTTCTGLYPPHSMLTLTPAPASNATFAGWSGGGCTGSSTCMVTLDAATTLTANFDWKFVPSHVSASAYRTNTANLSGVTSIDTHNLLINGAAPPTGIVFAFDSGAAVLSVNQWTVDSMVTVTGDSPLVVVAAGAVIFMANGSIQAGAIKNVSGPGGNLACALGAGGSFMFGMAGGGGGGDFAGGASASQGAAGMTYGNKLSDFCGGSKGGDGGSTGTTDTGCPKGLGGGGGGAIQISSAVSITIQTGFVNAGGGGGSPGCSYTPPPPGLGSTFHYPGGGGSGGTIFLEAPTISVSIPATAVSGGLFANGGGGGGAQDGSGTAAAGSDGFHDNTAARGGVGASGSTFGGNGAFSADGVVVTPATAPNPATSAGGGGGVGRIWLRTRGTTPKVMGNVNISPPPTIDMTL